MECCSIYASVIIRALTSPEIGHYNGFADNHCDVVVCLHHALNAGAVHSRGNIWSYSASGWDERQ